MDRRSLLKGLTIFPYALTSEKSSLSEVSPYEFATPVPEPGPLHPERPINPVQDQPSNFDHSALLLLEEIRYRGSQFFFTYGHSESGLMLDRVRVIGTPEQSAPVGSIAATGFALSALCVAAQHNYAPASRCEERILTTLEFLLTKSEHQHGFFPHYLDAKTGGVALNSEFSSIDTAILLAGALHAASYLNSSRVESYAESLYARVNWPWMTGLHAADGKGGELALCMGWHPATGFLQARWDAYSECLLMYLLAVGSPSYPIPSASWHEIRRNTFDYGGMRFISSYGALFIHQYLHLWADVRGMHDDYTNYFENSISAIHAHKAWCMLQHGRFPWVDERLWGFSASDSAEGAYQAWAAPPELGIWDATIAPHAAGGSLALLPEESVVVLKTIHEHYPKSFTKYGFTNAFRPGYGKPDWFDPYIISGDLALIMLMAENQQTGSVRSTFSRNIYTRRAMNAVGLRNT